MGEPRVISVGYTLERECIEIVISRGLKSGKLDRIPLSGREALELAIQAAQALQDATRP